MKKTVYKGHAIKRKILSCRYLTVETEVILKDVSEKKKNSPAYRVKGLIMFEEKLTKFQIMEICLIIKMNKNIISIWT